MVALGIMWLKLLNIGQTGKNKQTKQKQKGTQTNKQTVERLNIGIGKQHPHLPNQKREVHINYRTFKSFIILSNPCPLLILKTVLQKDRMGTIPWRIQRTHKARTPSEMQYQHEHKSWGRRGGGGQLLKLLKLLNFFRAKHS